YDTSISFNNKELKKNGQQSDEIDKNYHLFRESSNGQKEYVDKHGVHIIVGQYMGNGFPWNPQPNLTKDVLNENHYSPMKTFGENGSPVYVPSKDRSKAKELFFVNRFNLMASDMISVNRSLPDPRKAACRMKRYNLDLLPDTSIIVVFHNEAWSTLLRTVHSVLNRSPSQLLREIILVDDASDRLFLAKDLEEYVDNLSKSSNIPINIIRSKKRIGLIRARILGAEKALGKVLTFLDAHCETTIGWLEPLLQRISIDHKIVVCPVIDIINDQTFAYSRSFDSHWGAINWELNFRWFSVGHRELKRMRLRNYDQTSTYPSPIMAGGLFSIWKKYFFDMGTYDSHLEIWGGENIEMSLRIWQCGGRVEIAPCSHVAHLFRSSSPYNFGNKQVGDVLYANLIRVAEVWLDQWKFFFYKLNPVAASIRKENGTEILSNIEQRIKLRETLKCKTFGWFLENVWPENFFPFKDRRFVQIQSMHNHECLQRPSNGPNPTGKVITTKCALDIYGPQGFVIPVVNKPGFIMTDESVCLDVNSADEHSPVLLIACSEFDRQKWTIHPKTNFIVHQKSKLCLTLVYLHLQIRNTQNNSIKLKS
ncbi:polypeptide N-acetylgalactosaminyltransferase, partial [Blomia tropicalis]